jgi:hypothetical protein
MDYFQGVVAEYLRANRSTFVNPEFWLTLKADIKEPPKDTSWFVDLLAVNFTDSTVYLCEVTYAKNPAALIKRLAAWAANWPELVDALQRDAHIPGHWTVRPWLFVPEVAIPALLPRLPISLVIPKVTPLEMTLPWKFKYWNHVSEFEKPASIPPQMC